MTDYPVIRIHPAAPDKPAFGAPCNGCGVCCLAAPCPVSAALLRHRENACPALVWQEQGQLYRCGMLQHPAQYCRWLPKMFERTVIVLVRRWLALDIGCDSSLELEQN